MKCKKISALFLTGAMTLALAAPAFAADANTTVIDGQFKAITIDVSVPATGSAIINPYSMPVKAVADDASKTELTEVTTAGKIATNPLVIYNKTTTNLSVGATVTAEVPSTSGLEIVSVPVKDTATDKQAQVYLEAVRDTSLKKNDVVAAPDASSICGVKGTNVINAFNKWEPTTFNKSAKNQIPVIPGEESIKEGIAIMSAGKTAAGSTTADPEPGSFVLVRLAGTVAKNPETKWAATDTFKVNVAFSFTPLSPLAGGAITLSNATASTNQLTIAAPTGVEFKNETYKWEMVNEEGTSAADGFDDATIATPALTSTGTLATGTANVKCTVTNGDGNMYVSTATVTLN